MNTPEPIWPTEPSFPRRRGGSRIVPVAKRWRLPCVDPSHQPPSHIVIPAGSELVHVCPTCGMRYVIVGQDVTCQVMV